MSSILFDLNQLYQRTFGSKPYVVGPAPQAPQPGDPFAINEKYDRKYLTDEGGNTLRETLLGKEIWLPTILADLPPALFSSTAIKLPYSTIRVTATSTIIRTPLVERRGTVKELYSIDDYKITLKGFFIDLERRQWPYEDLVALKKTHEMGQAFGLDNAVSNVFLNATDKVVITGFELPEVEGGRKHMRPFIINLESDSVFELEYK